MDVRDILDLNTRFKANKVALIHQGRQYTYQWLSDRVSRLAQGLAKQLGTGELLAIWLPNSPELICLYLACLRCGIVPMPLHRDMKWPEVRQVLRYSKARILITTGQLMAATGGNVDGTGVERVYVIGAGQPAQPFLPYAELTSAWPDSLPVRAAPDTVGFVLHTSGSEGRPKGVMLSYGNLNHILDFRLAHTGLNADSVSVVASCLTQSVGLHQCLALLAAGGTMVLLDSYDIEQMVAAIHHHRPTHLIMVVHAFDQLLGHPAITGQSFQNTVFAAVGADRVTPRVQNRFIALTGKPLNVSYGMTESSWAIVNFEGRHDKCLALGKPGPGVRIRLMNGRGYEAAVGEVGEIQIRSPRTMLGYLHDDDLTRAAYADGWLTSGDLAYRDEEGYFWFAGRSKHIIVLSSGDNVSPVEVEQAILSHPGVAQCLVLAARSPDDDSDVPCAFVALADDTLSETALHGFLKERISTYKIPRKIVFVTELPVGLTGKMLRVPDKWFWPTG